MQLPPGPPKRFAHTSYCSGCQATVHGSCSPPGLAHTPANIQGMLNSDPSPAKNSVCVISGKYSQGLQGGGFFQSPFEEWGRQEAARWAAGLGPPPLPAPCPPSTRPGLSHSEMLLDLTGNRCCRAIKRTWVKEQDVNRNFFSLWP